MDHIANFKEFQENIKNLNDVFTPKQFDKLYSVLNPILLHLNELEHVKDLNKTLKEHSTAIQNIIEQGNFNLLKK